MTAARKPALVIVETALPAATIHRGRAATPTEALLLQIVPELLAAEAAARKLRALMDEQRRALAKERRELCIWPERVIEEFGNA